MAYGTPTDPVAGTVITVAFAVANFLNPIRALRTNTGGTDPPGSGYVVTSDSTSVTTWKTMLAAIQAAVGGTPVKTSGDTMTGNLVFSDILEGIVLAGGSHVRDDNTPSTGSFQILVEQGRFNVYNEAASPLLAADHTAGTFTFKGQTLYHSGNAGTALLLLSGGTLTGGVVGTTLALSSSLSVGGTTTAGAINAGAISGSTGTFSSTLAALSAAFTNAVTAASATLTGALNAASAAFSGAVTAASATISGLASLGSLAVSGAAAFTTQPTLGGEILSRVKSGTYVGNGAAGVTISVGFTVKLVILSYVGTNGLDHGTMNIVSTVAGTTIVHGDNGQIFAGVQDSAVLSGTGFVVYGSGGAFDALSNIGTATTTYYWVAFG